MVMMLKTSTTLKLIGSFSLSFFFFDGLCVCLFVFALSCHVLSCVVLIVCACDAGLGGFSSLLCAYLVGFGFLCLYCT